MEENLDKIVYIIIAIIIYTVSALIKKKPQREIMQEEEVITIDEEQPTESEVRFNRKKFSDNTELFLNTESLMHPGKKQKKEPNKFSEPKNQEIRTESPKLNLRDAVILSEIINKRY
jgi:hypothetical protein